MSTESRVRAARELHRFLGDGHRAHTPGAVAAVLSGLRAVIGYEWGNISGWDGAERRTSMLAACDWPADQLELWTTHIQHEPTFLGIQPVSPTLRALDVPPHERVGVLFEATFHTFGLSDAISLRLWTPDGRFVGGMSATTINLPPFDDLTVDLLQILAPRLAGLLDPIPDLWPASHELADGTAEGLVVTRTGQVRRLTDGADADLARPDGPLWPLIHAVSTDRRPTDSALVLSGGQVLSVSMHGGKHGTLLLHRTVPAPFGLSVRELEILNAVASGATNTQIATQFGLAPRTVATYIERLLLKTGCPNRTAAAQLAARLHMTIC